MAVNNTAGRTKKTLAFVILFGPAFILGFIGLQRCDNRFQELDDYGAAPKYEFVDAQGRNLSSEDFNDKVVVLNTLQVSCPNNCEISFWHFDQEIYQRVRKNKKKLGSVRIISFVVDENGKPLEDISSVNDMLKDQVIDYDPDVWYLASGDASEVFSLTETPGLTDEVDGYFGDEERWKLNILLDRQNHYRIAVQANTEGLVRKLKHYIALLQKEYDKKAARNQ